jgi:hypothetical protein
MVLTLTHQTEGPHTLPMHDLVLREFYVVFSNLGDFVHNSSQQVPLYNLLVPVIAGISLMTSYQHGR